MFSFKNLLAIPTILLCTSVLAEGIHDGLYLSLGIGKSKNHQFKDTNLPILSTIDVDFKEPNTLGLNFKTGTNYRGVLGCRFNDIRPEIELSHVRANYKLFTDEHGLYSATDADGNNLFPGHTHLTFMMANINYDFNHLNDYFIPYLGIGLGVASIKNQVGVEIAQIQNNAVIQKTMLKGKINEHKLIYQGIVGIKVPVSKEVSLLVDYRYLSTSSKLKAFENKFKNHSINFGLMIQF